MKKEHFYYIVDMRKYPTAVGITFNNVFEGETDNMVKDRLKFTPLNSKKFKGGVLNNDK